MFIFVWDFGYDGRIIQLAKTVEEARVLISKHIREKYPYSLDLIRDINLYLPKTYSVKDKTSLVFLY